MARGQLLSLILARQHQKVADPCFSALQFVPPAPKVLAEIKTKIFYMAFWSLILRLELSHNAILNKFQYDLA